MHTKRFPAAVLLLAAACQDDPITAAPARASIASAPLAVTADAPLAYVTHLSSSSVRVINTATNAQVAAVPVGSYPWEVAVSPDGKRAYVPANGAGTVTVVNTATQAVTTTLGVGAGPRGMAFSPDGRRAYVVNAIANTLSVIDTDTTNTRVVATVPVGTGPWAVVASPDGTRLYVSHGSGSVQVLDAGTFAPQATIAVGTAPMRLAISPDGARLYVANNSSGSVSVVNTATNAVVATVPVGQGPLGIEASPDGAEVWVLNQGPGTASVISTATNDVVATVPVGGGPVDLSFTSDGARAYVSYNASSNGTLAVVNTATRIASTVFSYPGTFFAVAVTPQARSQAISFSALADRVLGDPDVALSATATSGLPVTFTSLTPAACAVDGAIVRLVAAGSCEVAADQAGNASWLAAPRVTRAFAIGKRAQTIAFAELPDRVAGDAPFTLVATATSGLPVSFAAQGECTLEGTVLTLGGPGSCAVTASQAGDSQYEAAPSVTRAFTITEPAPPPPPAPPATLTIDPVGTFSGRTGAATVSGTLACGEAGTVTLAVSLWQHQKQGIAATEPALAVICPSAGVVRWTVALRGPVKLVGGPSTVTAAIVAGAPELSVRQGVRLKG